MDRKSKENVENARKIASAPYSLRSRPPLADLRINEKETNEGMTKKFKKDTGTSTTTTKFTQKSFFVSDNNGCGDLSIFEKRPISPIKERASVRSKKVKMPSRSTCDDDDDVTFQLFDPFTDEYHENIITYSLLVENKFVIKTEKTPLKYEKQWKNRNNALSWAYCVQDYLRVSNGTFLKAVYLFDNIIRNFFIPEDLMEMVILTLIWIEQKQTNTKNLFGAKKIISLKRSYTPQTLLYLEKKILQILDFNVIVEEPLQFVNYFLKKLNFSGKMLEHAMHTIFYLLESYVFNENFSKIPPSKLAAAAVLYQCDVKMPNLDWDNHTKNYCVHYKKTQLTPIVGELLINVQKVIENYSFKEVFERYKTNEKLRASRQFPCVNFGI